MSARTAGVNSIIPIVPIEIGQPKHPVRSEDMTGMVSRTSSGVKRS